MMNFLTEAWRAYPVLFDLLLYFLFFGAVSRAALAKTFPGHEGKVLSVAVGLVLAASLATAQRAMGFSIENLGPIAVFMICLVVFVAAYGFLASTGIPKPLTLFTCGILIAVMLNATMPEATEHFLDEHPGVGGIIPLAVLALLWWLSKSYANHARTGRGARALVRHKVIPSRKRLKREEREAERPLRKGTKRAAKREKEISRGLRKARSLLEGKGLSKVTRPKLFEQCEQALRKTRELEKRQADLVRLDQAVREFDVSWLRRARSVNLRRLTPEQQSVMKRAITEERERLHVEQEIEGLQVQVEERVRGMREKLEKCKECLITWNAPGAAGWLEQALEEEAKAERLEVEVLAWERKLLALVKRQERELAA